MTTAAPRPDVTTLTYEQARAELDSVVGDLERGSLPLDDVLALWERGEALVAHCRAALAGARARIEAATTPVGPPADPADEPF